MIQSNMCHFVVTKSLPRFLRIFFLMIFVTMFFIVLVQYEDSGVYPLKNMLITFHDQYDL